MTIQSLKKSFQTAMLPGLFASATLYFLQKVGDPAATSAALIVFFGNLHLSLLLRCLRVAKTQN